jgi:hypothetical protein
MSDAVTRASGSRDFQADSALAAGRASGNQLGRPRSARNSSNVGGVLLAARLQTIWWTQKPEAERWLLLRRRGSHDPSASASDRRRSGGEVSATDAGGDEVTGRS